MISVAHSPARVHSSPRAVEPDFPGEPRLPMPDWIEIQAQLFRLHRSNLADWLAQKLDDLAAECRYLRATTPDEFDAREEVLARDVELVDPTDFEGRD